MANRSWLFGIWPVLLHDAVGAATNRSELVLECTYQEHTIGVGIDGFSVWRSEWAANRS